MPIPALPDAGEVELAGPSAPVSLVKTAQPVVDTRPTAPVERVVLIKPQPEPPTVAVPPPPPDEPGPPDVEPEPEPEPPKPRADPTLRTISQVLTILAVVLMGFLIQLTLFGDLQHQRNQAQALRELRIQLAIGTAPVGPVDENNVVLPAGTPVAYLEIPRIEVEEVVLEGATARVMMSGPAHRRDSPLPGQAGTSLILGRRGAYGGPFRDLNRMQLGDDIVVTTGQGRHTFRVIGVRRAGDPLPPPLTRGKGRITLVTTDGPVFRPTDVLRVDADLTSDVQDRPPQVPSGSAPDNETFFAGDTAALLPLLLWGALLVVVAAALVWVRRTVGRARTWVIGVPVLALLGLLVLDNAAALLPNLL